MFLTSASLTLHSIINPNWLQSHTHQPRVWPLASHSLSARNVPQSEGSLFLQATAQNLSCHGASVYHTIFLKMFQPSFTPLILDNVLSLSPLSQGWCLVSNNLPSFFRNGSHVSVSSLRPPIPETCLQFGTFSLNPSSGTLPLYLRASIWPS